MNTFADALGNMLGSLCKIAADASSPGGLATARLSAMPVPPVVNAIGTATHTAVGFPHAMISDVNAKQQFPGPAVKELFTQTAPAEFATSAHGHPALAFNVRTQGAPGTSMNKLYSQMKHVTTLRNAVANQLLPGVGTMAPLAPEVVTYPVPQSPAPRVVGRRGSITHTYRQ